MKKDDIILVEFPFTDLSSKKKRPALVLATENLNVTVAFITTNLIGQQTYDVLLQPTMNNGLKRASLVRTMKLATLASFLVYGRLGALSITELQQIGEGLKRGLQL